MFFCMPEWYTCIMFHIVTRTCKHISESFFFSIELRNCFWSDWWLCSFIPQRQDWLLICRSMLNFDILSCSSSFNLVLCSLVPVDCRGFQELYSEDFICSPWIYSRDQKRQILDFSMHFVDVYIHDWSLYCLVNIFMHDFLLQDLFNVLQFKVTRYTSISHKILKSTLFCLQFAQVYISNEFVKIFVCLKERMWVQRENQTSCALRRHSLLGWNFSVSLNKSGPFQNRGQS
jgi:hypothetical protein